MTTQEEREMRRPNPGNGTKTQRVSKKRRLLLEVQNELNSHNAEVCETLCANCTTINFEAIYKLDPRMVPSEGVPVADLGSIDLDKNNENECRLCYMAATLVAGNILLPKDKEMSLVPCSLRAFSCLSALGLARTQPRLALSPSIVIAAIPCRYDEGITIAMRDASLAAGLVLPTINANRMPPSDRSLSYIGRTIEADVIDFGLVKDWMRECDDSHLSCSRSRAEQSIQDLIVIDCRTRLIVKLPSNASYVTLSYVWGTEDTDTSLWTVKLDEELPSGQPRTVEDALTVVNRIEERYLWIDRYSIDQMDEHAKQHAILNMASIFEGAVLTIVSLASHVSTGLWGVSSTSRSPQPTVKASSLQLVSSGVVLEQTLQHSAWSRRGWTLQEALLSRRMLFFSYEQVYWKCSAITYRESVRQPRAADSVRIRSTPAFDPDLFSEANQYRKRFGEMLQPIYARQVAEYTKRHLTYESDALNAFRAILSLAREVTFYGVPVFMIQDTTDCSPYLSDAGFLLGLLWSRSAHQWYKPWKEFSKKKLDSQIESRREFPSWSWTSTTHSVQFDPLSFSREMSNKHRQLYANVYRHSPYIVPYARVEIPDHGSVVETLQHQIKTQSSENKLNRSLESALPQSLHFSSVVVSWTFSTSTTELLPSKIDLRVMLNLPDSQAFSMQSGWLGRGFLYLDNDSEFVLPDLFQQPDYKGTALLLLHQRRYGYNMLHVVWWMALTPDGEDWRRIGLIRSVYESEAPKYLAKDASSPEDREHRRPFLPASSRTSSSVDHPPDKELVEEHYRTVVVV